MTDAQKDEFLHAPIGKTNTYPTVDNYSELPSTKPVPTLKWQTRKVMVRTMESTS